MHTKLKDDIVLLVAKQVLLIYSQSRIFKRCQKINFKQLSGKHMELINFKL